MSKNSQIAIALILVLVVGFFLMSSKPEPQPAPVYVAAPVTEPTTAPPVTPEPVMMETVSLALKPDAENVEVAQSGTVKLEESDKGLTVTLKMSGYQSTVPQPAHIHMGTCPEVGKVAYPLTNVVNGNSTTVLPGVTIAGLKGQLPLAVNVHKSAEEVSVYTSCGDLVL